MFIVGSIIRCSFFSLSIFNKDSSINKNNNFFYISMYLRAYPHYSTFSYRYTKKTHIISYCPHYSDIIIISIFSAELIVAQTALTICVNSCVHSFSIYLVLISCQVIYKQMEIKQDPCTIIAFKKF